MNSNQELNLWKISAVAAGVLVALAILYLWWQFGLHNPVKH